MRVITKMTIWVVVILLAILGGVFYILVKTGLIKIGADAIIGCQNTKNITVMLGQPGRNLQEYDFFGNKISINKEVVPFLDKVQNDIKAAKIDYKFTNVTSYNNRYKRGGGGRSLHAWGIAIDINPETNPQGGGSDLPPVVIDAFKRHGFFWGGDWHGRETDPMHFEWYGAKMSGDIIDTASKQRVLEPATAIDGSGSPNLKGEYVWIVPYGQHEITAVSKGYKESKFSVDLTCFSSQDIQIALEPLSSNVPGSITGKVKITGNYPLLVPANLYLDDKLVAASSLKGDFYIPNVKEGKHTIEANLVFFPGSSVETTLVPGENLKDVNILIGK